MCVDVYGCLCRIEMLNMRSFALSLVYVSAVLLAHFTYPTTWYHAISFGSIGISRSRVITFKNTYGRQFQYMHTTFLPNVYGSQRSIALFGSFERCAVCMYWYCYVLSSFGWREFVMLFRVVVVVVGECIRNE